jgi:replication factor A2
MKGAAQEHPDAPFFVHGKQGARVVLVGRVAKKAESTSNLQVLVDDGSGSIDVHLYVDEAAAHGDGGVKSALQEGMHVKVIGMLRSFADKRSLKASRILIVTDPDEVAHHALAAQYALKCIQRGAARSGAATGAYGAPVGAYTASTASSSAAYGAPGGAGVAGGGAGGKPLEQAVLQVIQGAYDEAGASVQSICDAMRVAPDQVRKAIDSLATDGFVYSTIDDDHYKACN